MRFFQKLRWGPVRMVRGRARRRRGIWTPFVTLRPPMVDVIGEAERRITPDRVVVSITIQTAILPSPAEALALGVERRARVRVALASGAPDATVSDARVTAQPDHEHAEEPDVRGRVTSRSVVRGYTGVCRLNAGAEAGRAAALMAIAGAQPDVTNEYPSLAIGPALRRDRARARAGCGSRRDQDARGAWRAPPARGCARCWRSASRPRATPATTRTA